MPIPICMNPRGCMKYEPIDRTPLTLTALETGSTVTLTNPQGSVNRYGPIDFPNLKYRVYDSSTDTWSNWTRLFIDNTITLQNVNDAVQLWNQSTSFNKFFPNRDDDGYLMRVGRIGTTGKINLYGNVQSLLDFSRDCTEIGNFMELFYGSSGLYDASNLLLGAHYLTYKCYGNMFQSSGLQYPPTMFSSHLVNGCFAGMFSYCKKLLVCPPLPAVFLPTNCYQSMFQYCESLTSTALMPQKIMVSPTCMSHMYSYCKNLTSAYLPYMESEKVSGWVCYHMLYGCNSLNQITVDFTNWGNNDESDWFYSWIDGVALGGTFYKPLELSEEYSSRDAVHMDRIPEDWTVINK